MLERAGDLAAMLTNLEPNDVLFIDEIHRLNPVVEEILYPALEDYQIDIMIGEGPAARSVKLDLPPFTLVGATTRAGMLTNPLRDRFGIVARLEFYSPQELKLIVARSAQLLNVKVDDHGAQEIAQRSRGTPRIANRLLRRVRDFAEVRGNGHVDKDTADAALKMLDVDKIGLDMMDRKMLLAIIEKFSGGPVGVENLAAAPERGARYDRGRAGAVSDPTGLSTAHTARAHGHTIGLSALWYYCTGQCRRPGTFLACVIVCFPTALPHPALQAALPAASGSRFTGVPHAARIPRSTPLPQERVRNGRSVNQKLPHRSDHGQALFKECPAKPAVYIRFSAPRLF